MKTAARVGAIISLLIPISIFGAEPTNPAVAQVRTVYLLPMAHGFDQYLANRLTQTGRFQVVTTPESADAIFTDRLGEAFEQKYAELYPPPPAPKEKSSDEQSGEADSKATAATADQGAADTQKQEKRTSTFGGSKGNVFLVDRQSRQVIWSFYKRPHSTQPDDLDDLAGKMVGQLRKHAGDTPPPVSPSPNPGTSAPVNP